LPANAGGNAGGGGHGTQPPPETRGRPGRAAGRPDALCRTGRRRVWPPGPREPETTRSDRLLVGLAPGRSSDRPLAPRPAGRPGGTVLPLRHARLAPGGPKPLALGPGAVGPDRGPWHRRAGRAPPGGVRDFVRGAEDRERAGRVRGSEPGR